MYGAVLPFKTALPQNKGLCLVLGQKLVIHFMINDEEKVHLNLQDK